MEDIQIVMAVTKEDLPILPERARILEAMGGCRTHMNIIDLEHNLAFQKYLQSLEELRKFIEGFYGPQDMA